jgi:hypothetical protein
LNRIARMSYVWAFCFFLSRHEMSRNITRGETNLPENLKTGEDLHSYLYN